jgi:hypothetical protein
VRCEIQANSIEEVRTKVENATYDTLKNTWGHKIILLNYSKNNLHHESISLILTDDFATVDEINVLNH